MISENFFYLYIHTRYILKEYEWGKYSFQRMKKFRIFYKNVDSTIEWKGKYGFEIVFKEGIY